jgi:toluene monooxygenase system ferredoxin subunit
MAFTTICTADAVQEGGMGLFKVGKKSVLLLWPKGGALKAFRGRCPHADMPLDEATFDGVTLVCNLHQWGFSADDGRCTTHIVRNALHAYPLQVAGDEIQVDVGPLRPERATA